MHTYYEQTIRAGHVFLRLQFSGTVPSHLAKPNLNTEHKAQPYKSQKQQDEIKHKK